MSEQEVLNGNQPEETIAVTGETQAREGEEAATEQERLFTQEELNRVISRRVAEERARADAALRQRESELLQREYAYHVQSTLNEKRLPPQLAEILKGGDKDTFDKSLGEYERILLEGVQTGVIEKMSGTAPKSAALSGQPSPRDTIRGAMGLKERK